MSGVFRQVPGRGETLGPRSRPVLTEWGGTPRASLPCMRESLPDGRDGRLGKREGVEPGRRHASTRR
jgi:hypothetical protein